MKNLHSMRRDPAEQDQQQLDKVRKTLRGRAEKACVRCRAKKRTCDGGQPCHRCKESHSACYFSDWHYTVPYPREYVEYLEEQQEQLSTGLMTMYRLLKDSHITTIPPLPDKPQAQDLLVALRGLRLDKQSHPLSHPSNEQNRQTNGSIISFANSSAQPESRPQEHMAQAQNCFEAASRSPTQPSTFMPSFPPVSVQGQNAPGPPPSAIPTSMPGSFVSLTYPSFDYARATHPQIHHSPSQDATFSPIHANSPVFGQLSAEGITSTSSETWPFSHDPSLSPTTALQTSPQTSAPGRSPRSMAEESDHGNHDQQMMNHYHQTHQQQWHWTGEVDMGVGFYRNGSN